MFKCAEVEHVADGTFMSVDELQGSSQGVEEHVAIFQQTEQCRSVLAVIAWTRMKTGSTLESGSTDWLLFRSVLDSIEKAVSMFPGLDLQRAIVLVEAGKQVEYLPRNFETRYADLAAKCPDQVVPTDTMYGGIALKNLFPVRRTIY